MPPAALAAPTVSIFALAAAYLRPQLEADDGATSRAHPPPIRPKTQPQISLKWASAPESSFANCPGQAAKSHVTVRIWGVNVHSREQAAHLISRAQTNSATAETMSSLFSRDSRPFTSFSGVVVNQLFTRPLNQLKSWPMTKFDPRTTQDDPEHTLEYL